MEGNFSCSSCPLAATFVCICIPEKVYLCAQCIGVHCQKGGAHAIVPASGREAVSKPQEIEGYNKKLQVIRELTTLLDEMSADLSKERNDLAANLKKVYIEQVNLLDSAYAKTGADLDAVYQSLSEDLQRVKEEISECERRAQRGNLTKSTQRFVCIAAHIRESPRTYVNVQDELIKRIKHTLIDVQSPARSLESLIDVWGLKPCMCQNCLNYKRYLVPRKTAPELMLPLVLEFIPSTPYLALPSHIKMLDLIASGQYSDVLKAVNEEQGVIAIKRTPIEQLKKEPLLISREVKILEEVSHPHIVQYYGCYKDDEFFYMTMELCGGGNLQELIDRDEQVPEARVQMIAKETLEALDYLHHEGYAHRDIKPENILLTDEGHVKLVDFSSCRHKTEKHQLIGTPYYISPEMFLGNYTLQSDMWSLGVALYFALTGILPFKGEDIHSLCKAITTEEIVQWRNCSDLAIDFLKKMTLKSPKERLTPAKALLHPWITLYNDVQAP